MNSATDAQPAVVVDIPDPGVAHIRMQDRDSKNGFSVALCTGLIEAFAWIESREDIRVAILTGYDNYFASGGTQTGLMTIQEGKGSFTDTNVYSLALDCSIPVIAAMQGHAIGGGFAMGLHADFVVLCREAVYTANFMRYGFTPGMGATYILRQKLGIALAQEMLLAAETFRGATLQERGVPFPVLPRKQLPTYVQALARSVAQKPRKALQLLKRHLVGDIRAALPAVIEAEVAMHRETFHDDEVRNRIGTLFRNPPT